MFKVLCCYFNMVLYLRIMWMSFIPREDSDTVSDFFHVFWRNCCSSFYLSEGFCIQHPCSSLGRMEMFVFYHEMLPDHSSPVMESSLHSVIRLCLERKETCRLPAYQRPRLYLLCVGLRIISVLLDKNKSKKKRHI